jgi:hypothetical protein
MVLCTNIYPGRCDSDSAIVCIYCTKKKTRILCSFLASLSFLNFFDPAVIGWERGQGEANQSGEMEEESVSYLHAHTADAGS